MVHPEAASKGGASQGVARRAIPIPLVALLPLDMPRYIYATQNENAADYREPCRVAENTRPLRPFSLLAPLPSSFYLPRLISQIVSPVVFSCVVYFMVGLQPDAGEGARRQKRGREGGSEEGGVKLEGGGGPIGLQPDAGEGARRRQHILPPLSRIQVMGPVSIPRAGGKSEEGGRRVIKEGSGVCVWGGGEGLGYGRVLQIRLV